MKTIGKRSAFRILRQEDLRRQSGFTLMELLVVLAILALVAAFAIPNLMKILGGAKSDVAGIQIDNLKTALNIYRLENGGFPTQEQGLKAMIERPEGADLWDGPYLDNPQALLDPWGKPYLYKSPGRSGAFEIYTLGADGKEGGAGENADIRS